MSAPLSRLAAVRSRFICTLPYSPGVDLNEPLPRLLRLRGMVTRSVPPDEAKIGPYDAPGLIDAYIRLRDAVRDVATGLGVNAEEFNRELPSLEPFGGDHLFGASWLPVTTSRARTAATLLKSLVGCVEGLIETVVLSQQITMEQIQAAREAARHPPGFR
jgi:hypothetical protein